MKKFKDFVKEEGEGAVPTNAVGTGGDVAGLTGDPPVYPPVSKKKQKYINQNILKAKSLQ